MSFYSNIIFVIVVTLAKMSKIIKKKSLENEKNW